MGKITKRWLSWVLAAAMVITGVSFPVMERTAQAAETSINLTVKSGASPLMVVKNEYDGDYIGDVMFNIPSQAADRNAISSNGVKSIEVSVTVNQITSGSSPASAMLYVQPGEDGKWAWNQSEAARVVNGQSYTLTYSFSGMDWNGGSTMGNIGLRFANCAAGSSITYTINSAKLIMETGSTGGSSSGGTSTGSDVTIESTWAVEDDNVLMSYTAEDLYDSYTEYKFAVENLGSSTVYGDLVITFDKGRTDHWHSSDFSINLSSNVLTVSNLSIPAGGSAGPIHVQLEPLGASITCVTFAGKKIAIGKSKGSTEAGELKYKLTGKGKTVAFEDTPVGKHGKLSLQKVDGYGNAPVIVDKNGKPFQLRGASTHGMHWFEGYVNEAAFQNLRDEWGVNMVRLVVYPKDSGGGYLTGYQSKLDELIDKGVAAAQKLGMYVLIDWHVHQYNPNDTKSEAETFFRNYVAKYGNLDNVLFEICNEPTGTPWYNGGNSDLHSYCKDIVGIIRDECKNNSLVICGTNNWSQDVDDVAGHSMADLGYSNIMYTFHFYSATHKESFMNKVKTAVAAGTPIFVTEYGICDASGGSPYDIDYADKWIAMLDSYNISYACWSMCNKGEAASYFKSSCNKTSGWTEEDLSATGVWLVNTYRAHEDKENNTDTSISGSGSGSTGGNGGSGSTGGNGGSGNTGGTGDTGNTGGAGDGGSAGNGGDTGSTGDSKNTGNGGNTGGTEDSGNTGTGGNAGGTGGDISGTGDTGGGETDTASVKKVTIKKVIVAKKKLTVTWKKAQGASGYQVSVSLKKNFAKAKVVKVNSGKKTKAVVKKLKSKKKYYVRVRAFSKADGKTVYGAWSKTKSKKVK